MASDAFLTVDGWQSCAVQGTRARHGHTGCITKDEIRQSTGNGPDRPIHEADKGHTGHYSNIDERCARISR